MLIQNSYATVHYPEFHCKQHRCEDSFVKKKKETSNTALVTFFLGCSYALLRALETLALTLWNMK